MRRVGLPSQDRCSVDRGRRLLARPRLTDPTPEDAAIRTGSRNGTDGLTTQFATASWLASRQGGTYLAKMVDGMVVLEVRDVEQIPALPRRQLPAECTRVGQQISEEVSAYDKEQIDELGLSVRRSQHMAVTDIDATPPPDAPTTPLIDRVNLVAESAQLDIGFVWPFPTPQKLVNSTLLGGVQIFEHSQMTAALELGRQLYPREVLIVGVALTQLNEIPVCQLKRAHSGRKSTTRRPKRIGPITLTARRPTEAVEMGSR